jgi:ABC-type branched-subunit amino acid transport system substrate-binding protein
MARRHRPQLLAGAACLAVLTACSSAPAPVSLSQNGGTTGGSQLGGTTGTGPLGTTGTSGGVLVPGGSTGGSAGGTTGVVSGTTGGTSGTTGGSTGVSGTTGRGAGTTGGTLRSQLFTPAEDRIGITKSSLTMCAHAALTYGKAFNTDESDLNVFWTALNKEKGGIFGRKVDMTYEDDAYDPTKAVVAAGNCIAKHPFMLLGGIGFDQIPSVRNYAEQQHQLYLYHTATIQGSQGLKYSFSELPTVERVGQGFAQLAAAKYRGKKIGILKRDSTNWEPGVVAFKKLAKAYGLDLLPNDEKAAPSAGNYTSQITNLKNAGAQVVFIWLNALESTEVVKQMKAQLYSPNLMVFPFNLTSQTLMSDALNPVMDGVAMYPSYSKGDYSGPFASYADDMKEFERQYAAYDPNADISGVGGDLLFLNWTAQRALYTQLLQCGPDCTRNRFIDLLQAYKGTPISSACPIDFRAGDHHHGGTYVTFMETYSAPGGKVNWRETTKCVAAP